MSEWYKEDLAYIHDVGHSDFARGSAPGILAILRQHNICDGLVTDLGCGSGLWAQELIRAGYDVFGVDISEPMIRLARKRVPQARFQTASLFTVELPTCRAVTSLGECVNYLFDSDHDRRTLLQFFRRIWRALTPGGVFIFDLAEPGQLSQEIVRGFSEGEDWMVVSEKREDRKRQLLTRRITSFRRVGKHYRRSDETHRLRLYKAVTVARELRQTGFRARVRRSYGAYPLPKAHAAFIARKPA
jgi:SAM-dependent methyltransferase